MATNSTSPAADSQPTGSSTHELIHDKLVHWLRNEAAQDIDRIDYDQPLYELGVDSMGAAMVAGELEQSTGKTLNPELMYELETINDLAEYVDSLVVSPRPPQQAPTCSAPVDTAQDSKIAMKLQSSACVIPATHAAAGGHGGSSAPGAAAAPYNPVQDKLHHFAQMNRRVKSLKEQGLYFFEPEISEHDGAWVVANGQRMLMLGSYEYLGLLQHPHLKETAIKTIEKYGTGHHGVRLLAGTTSVHRELEAKLADFMQAEDAVVYSSGFMTNMATISALVGRGEVVIGDQWNHASIVDGCRMSGAEFREFKHNDMDDLANHLNAAGGRRTLVVVDGVFSMDGDIIDLPKVVDLCRRHNALLMVDEAHSLGVLGKTGHGIQEHFGMDADAIDIKMGTLSKTLAGCGGFVAGREEITTFLRHHARGYIFSGALPAGQASVATAALEVIEREPELVEKLWSNVHQYLEGCQKLGFDTAKSCTPIVPLMTRNNEITLEMTRICRSRGLLVIPVCFPAVPLDSPRLRTCVSAIHGPEDIDFALEILGQAGRETGLLA